jgi:hypothetical protein
MPLTQVDQAAEQLDTQVHRKVTAQVQQEYQVKEIQAEILETKVVAVVAVPLAQALQAAGQVQMAQVAQV